MSSRRVIAVRHAPTEADGLCVGAAEVPTSLAAPTAAAAIIAAHAPLRTGARPSSVWSSPLTRCADPAALVAAALGAPLRIDARLGELSLGRWQGRRYADVEREEPAAFAAWMANWRAAAPPGGETLSAFEARVGGWWHGLLRGDEGLLVAHAGVVRALRVLVSGASWEAALATPVPHLRAELFTSP